VEQILETNRGMKVRVFGVWEPILRTDWQRPSASVLGRIGDERAHQYWDPGRLLAARIAADARDPQPRQQCCVRDGFLWDLAAVYPPGVKWTGQLPPAVFFNGPVLKVRDELEGALVGLARH
jgi:hypothetical protein